LGIKLFTLGNLQILVFRQTSFLSVLSLKKQHLLFVVNFLKKSENYLYSSLIDFFVVDLLNYNNLVVRFQLNYVLLSFVSGRRLIVRLLVSEKETVPTLNCMFLSAGWLEREMWDMFGIFFVGHPDLRRILTDYGFVGYPLRKDYPLVGYEEVRFDHDCKKVISEPIKLMQEYRYFDFLTPWQKT